MDENVLNYLIAKPGHEHKVSDFDTDHTGTFKKAYISELMSENKKKISKLQNILYANDRYSVLIIFQAMDAAGKDSTIKSVMSGINPQGCQVFSFKQPSSEELDHDYLWRINKALPEKGRIGIFNRSHYEDVLISKVHPEILLKNKIPGIKELKDIDEEFWNRRYRQINDFEKYLTENGTVIIKFFLNISKEEQAKRFLSRIKDKSKNWKFSSFDITEREFWDKYMSAYSAVLTKTSKEWAPWYVIPADNKRFMQYVTGQIILNTLSSLSLSYPEISKEEKNMLGVIKKNLLKEIDEDK
ncbi:MAG: polyphosphate kinase 2 family protein [Bacteroidales bacterium]|nr:polyphosphate kinase 2 family protein [Bacteroidales bacterium]